MTSPVKVRLPSDLAGDLPELIEQQPVEFLCFPSTGGTLELSVDGLLLSPFLQPGDAHWRWQWNPGAAVGRHTLRLVVTNGERREIVERRILITPCKIDRDRYLALLDDVERVATGLVRSLAGGAIGAAAVRGDGAPRSFLDEAVILFGAQYDVFEQAVLRILAQPRVHLQKDRLRLPLARAARIGPETLRQAARGDLEAAPPGVAEELQRALRPEGGLLPRVVMDMQTRATSDTYEHRLLKRTLETLCGRARRIAAVASHEVERLEPLAPDSVRAARARMTADRVGACARRLSDLLAAPLFDQVAPLDQVRGATHLIRHDPSYRQVYRMWQAMQQHLAIVPGAPFDLAIIELPLLYERWCALQVVRALLAAGGTLREQRLLARSSDDDAALVPSLQLSSDAPLLIVESAGWTLTLRYQPRYRPAPATLSCTEELVSLDRHTRVPDITIEATRAGAAPRVLVFDAKYRLEHEGWGVPRDALAEAYAYAGAIGYRGAPAVTAALLLYPGSGEPERYPGGAGAVPLLPGATTALDAALAAELP